MADLLDHICLCGHGSGSSPSLKRHRRTCSIWAGRDKDLVKRQNTEKTMLARYGTTDVRELPYFVGLARECREARECKFCGNHVSERGVEHCIKCVGVASRCGLAPSEGFRAWYESHLRSRVKNIDTEATKSAFGYYPFELAPLSKKPVVAVCEFCLSAYESKMSIIESDRSVGACKGCDAVASSYVLRADGLNKRDFYLRVRKLSDLSSIDMVATNSEYGWTPGQFTSYSTKKVVAICKHCQVRVRVRMSKYSARAGNIACRGCVRKKTIETLLSRYGVECTLDIPSVREKLANPMTEQIVESVLKDRYGVDYIRGHCIGPYSFDFFIPSMDLLIECQGDYFHNFKENGYSGLPKDRSKMTYVERYTGYKLVWIWEHEIHVGRMVKILDHHLYPTLDEEVIFSLSDLEHRPISSRDAHSFLTKYHYLGNLGNVSTCFGTYYGDILVTVGAFGGVTRNQTIQKINKFTEVGMGPGEIRELRRFCIRPGAHVKNLASYCLARFTSMLFEAQPNVKAVVSFSDPTVGDLGIIYKASNWSRMPDSVASYHYFDPSTRKPIHKKTVWDLAKGAHMSESDFSSSAGLIKVGEMPKHMWLYVPNTRRPHSTPMTVKETLGKHSPESVARMRDLYLARSSSCKFCSSPIDGKRTCINGRVSCRSCKALKDAGLASFTRPDGSFLPATA